jgi:hypothetical protein
MATDFVGLRRGAAEVGHDDWCLVHLPPLCLRDAVGALLILLPCCILCLLPHSHIDGSRLLSSRPSTPT